ncbi:MAG TPA: hypothetical protein VFX48_04065 [Saprospiraceae bacterium]|nr:hypothetical protein [Saprospiraceae bacterium]
MNTIEFLFRLFWLLGSILGYLALFFFLQYVIRRELIREGDRSKVYTIGQFLSIIPIFVLSNRILGLSDFLGWDTGLLRYVPFILALAIGLTYRYYWLPKALPDPEGATKFNY